MSFPSNKELWLSWSALWNGNLSIVDEIIAPNLVAHFAPIGNSPGEVHGPDGLKQWMGAAVRAFTDCRFTTTVGPLADEDHVAGRWLFRAIYHGGYARSFTWCSWKTGRVCRDGPLSCRSWENRRIVALCRHAAIIATNRGDSLLK